METKQNSMGEEISNPCIFNKKILQATFQPSAVWYHMHMHTSTHPWAIICHTFLQVIKTCMLHWQSSCWSTVNTPCQRCRRKHWLQYDALLIWQGQMNLCQHSLLRLYLTQLDRYKIKTRMHNYQPIILDWRYSNVGWERPLVKISPSCSVVSIFKSLISAEPKNYVEINVNVIYHLWVSRGSCWFSPSCFCWLYYRQRVDALGNDRYVVTVFVSLSHHK